MSMDSLLEQAKKIREKRDRDLSKTFAKGRTKGGKVVAKMDGHRHLVSIRINPAVIDPEDLGTLKKLVMEAVNDATDEMEIVLERKFGPSSGIPDLF